VIHSSGTMTIDEMMPLLMAVMADAMKDKRADQQVRDMMGQLSLNAKAATLNKQSEAIVFGMQESDQKATIAMDQATNSLVMGCVMGAVQIGAACCTYGGQTAGTGKADGALATAFGTGLTGLNQALGGINSYMQGMAEHDKLAVDGMSSKSAHAKIEANDLQIAQNEAERADTKADDQLKSQKEHIQNLKDNFKKLLDMWSQMSQSAVNAYR